MWKQVVQGLAILWSVAGEIGDRASEEQVVHNIGLGIKEHSTNGGAALRRPESGVTAKVIRGRSDKLGDRDFVETAVDNLISFSSGICDEKIFYVADLLVGKLRAIRAVA